MDTVMKRAIFAVIFCLAAASTAAAVDDTLAGLIQAGNRDAALKKIAAGADVNAAQGDGTTPLHWAVYKIDADLARALLERKAKPDVINNYGSSPLAEAVKVANARLVEMLLDAGSNVEVPNQEGQTALMLAARAGSLDVAELLVRHGANVNAREKWRGQTALMWAAAARSAELTRFLIDHKADVNARAFANDWPSQMTGEPRNQYRPAGGLTPLLYAARSGCTGCVQALLDAGANPNGPHPAVRGGRHEYVQSGCLRRTHRTAHRDDEDHRAGARTTVSRRRRQPQYAVEHASARARRQLRPLRRRDHNHRRHASVARRSVSRQRGRAAIAGIRRACRRAQRD